jgi:hypothetical protein
VESLTHFCEVASAFAAGLKLEQMSPAQFEVYMDMQRYTFDDADVARYLIRKQAWEVIGWCADSSHCFLMESLRSKYPELESAHTDLDPLPVFVIPGLARICHLISMTGEMIHALKVFDAIGKPGQAVTKEQFIDAWLTTARRERRAS